MADIKDIYALVRQGDTESAFHALAAIKGIDPALFPDLSEGIRQEIAELEKQIETKKRKAFKMKIYEIKRHEDTVVVQVRDTLKKETYPLVHIGYHSNGFEYGYGGSGPADLAWSILANFLGESNLTDREQRQDPFLSQKLHQKFKEDFIVPLAQSANAHAIYETEIMAWFSLNFSSFDIADYKRRRDEFRPAMKKLLELENQFSETEEGYDEVKAEWNRLEKIHESYFNWFYALELKDE